MASGYISSGGGFAGALTISGIKYDEHVKAQTCTLEASELYNSVINNYGQSAAATYTLPAAAEGLAFMGIVSATGNALHVKAGANDKIYLDGTALDDGDKVTLATPAVGNCFTCFAFQTGAGPAYDWFFSSINGVYSDGGA